MSATPYYRVGSYYVDDTDPANPVLYRCHTAGDKASSGWAKITGAGGSSGCQQFKIISDGGDYWVCKSWDGATLGAVTQNILKPFKLRAGANAIATEIIRGVTYTYTYTAVTVGSVTGYYTRTVAGSDGSSETDYVIPDPLANDIIYATPCEQPLPTIPMTILSATVVNPGTGGIYAVNDILTAAGGTGTAATLKVTAVAAGKITGIVVATPGSYTVAPSLSANAATGGGGTGATFALSLAPVLIDDNRDARAWAA